MRVQHLNLNLPDVGKHYVRKGDNRIVKVIDMFIEGSNYGIVEYRDVATDFIFYVSAIQFVDQYQPVTGMW
mgnify:CR=1 FL=1